MLRWREHSDLSESCRIYVLCAFFYIIRFRWDHRIRSNLHASLESSVLHTVASGCQNQITPDYSCSWGGFVAPNPPQYLLWYLIFAILKSKIGNEYCTRICTCEGPTKLRRILLRNNCSMRRRRPPIACKHSAAVVSIFPNTMTYFFLFSDLVIV